LRVGRHLPAKLHADQVFLLLGRDLREVELRGANRGVQLIKEYLVLWQGGANGESGHGSNVRGTGLQDRSLA